MTVNKSKEIRAYLLSGAGGTFHGVDSYDVIMKALKHSKITDVSGEEFEQVLKMHGLRVDQRGDGFILVLPPKNK